MCTIYIRLSDDEVELRLLTADDVKSIHDLYPAGDIESIEVFEKLIHRLPGFGVFSLKTGELVAWMVQSYYGKKRTVKPPPSGVFISKYTQKIYISLFSFDKHLLKF